MILYSRFKLSSEKRNMKNPKIIIPTTWGLNFELTIYPNPDGAVAPSATFCSFLTMEEGNPRPSKKLIFLFYKDYIFKLKRLIFY